MGSEGATVTLIIPAHNNWAYSQLLLDGLRRYSGCPYSVLFVDNGSSDETAREIGHYPEARVIHNASNLGFGKAVNQAVKRVETEFFAILNNDVYPSPSCLEVWVELLRENPRYWQLAPGSNCNMDPPHDFRGVSCRSWIDYRDRNRGKSPLELIEGYYPGSYDDFCREVTARAASGIEEVASPPGWVAGWGILMRTDVRDRLGDELFDERFEIGFSEDMDLSWRVVQAGGGLGIARSVFLHHFINATFDILDRDKQGVADRNYRLLVDKWEPLIRAECRKLTGGDLDRLQELVRSDPRWRQCAEYLGMRALLSDPD